MQDFKWCLGSFSFHVTTVCQSSVALIEAKNVLAIIDQRSFGKWPSISEWKKLLPAEFVSTFRLPLSKEQAEEWLTWWRRLNPEEQMDAENKRVWSLEDWLYWMQPDNRCWFWQASKLIDECQIRFYLNAFEWPFPWGSFRCLLLGVGAKEVTSETV